MNQKPSNPKLAKLYMDAVRSGAEIRHVDETTLVVWSRNTWGCGGVLLLIILGVLTAFIVPLILLFLGALAPGGQITTYTLMPSGRVKKKQRRA